MYKEIFEIIKSRLDNNTALKAFLAEEPVYGFAEGVITGKMPYLIVEPMSITEDPQSIPTEKNGVIKFELHGKIENNESASDLISDALDFAEIIFNALDGGPDFSSGGKLVKVNNSLDSMKMIGDNTREIIITTEITTQIFTEGDR